MRARGLRRLPVLLLVLTLTTVVACSSDDEGDDVTTGDATAATDTTTPSDSPDTGPVGTTGPDATTTSGPGATDAPTTGASGEPPTTGPSSYGDPAVTCEGAPTPADIDGDGVDDGVLATSSDDGLPIVEVCPSGSVGGFVLQQTGEGELSFADIDGDGAAEIFYGGTQATSRTVGVARMVDGTLLPVIRGDGVPIVLIDGYPEGLPPDGPRVAFGCDDHDTGRVLVTLELNEIDRDGAPVIDGVWSAYGLDGQVVTQVDTAPVTAEGYDDTLTTLDELVASWAPPC